MIKLFAFPFLVAGLMSMAWVSTLGGSLLIWLSGLTIFCLNFWVVLLARRRVVSNDLIDDI